MEVIKFDRIVSVNSELQGHGARNILNGEISPNKNWMCEKGTEKAVVILQLQRAAILTSVHVGNAHSAFVEVLVGKAADSSDQFESLIPMSVFMNPQESKTSSNPNRTRFFKKADFNEATAGKSWDRIKVVCSQPFNKHVPFGLCFLEVHGEKVEIPKKAEEEEGGDEIEVGSFFKKKRSSGGEKPLTVSQQIKEAEKETSLGQHTPLSMGKISEKFSSNKKQKTDEEESKKKGEEKATKRKKEEGSSEKKEETPVKRRKEGKTEDEKRTRKKEEKEKPRKRRRKPFEKLLEDVVLVISGFKNPLRGDIRSMALRMGAKYSGDWEPHCTHLVCAYENTPKARQVKGKGKIVRKEWVEKCHEDKMRYPWRRFALDKTESKEPESEEEIDAGEESEPEEVKIASCSNTEAVTVTQEKTAETECYDVATDDEEEKTVDTTYYPMPFLPDLLSLKTFYVDPNLNGRASVERYIIAYKGILSKNFNDGVDFYVTDTCGAPVELFRKKAPNVVAVKPSWIWEINAKQEYVPTSPHIVR